MRDLQAVADPPRIVHGITAATACPVPVLLDAQAHGDARDGVIRLDQQLGGHGRIDAATHGDQDLFIHDAIPTFYNVFFVAQPFRATFL